MARYLHADEAFLHHAHDETSRLVEEEASRQTGAPNALGESWSNSSQLSALKGRWNHMQWSKLTIIVAPVSHGISWGWRIESMMDMSEA